MHEYGEFSKDSYLLNRNMFDKFCVNAFFYFLFETGTLILNAKPTLSFLNFIDCTQAKPYSFFVNAPHVFYQYSLDLTIYLFASKIERRVCIRGAINDVRHFKETLI